LIAALGLPGRIAALLASITLLPTGGLLFLLPLLPLLPLLATLGLLLAALATRPLLSLLIAWLTQGF
jgi:hypothetical protein